MESLLYRRKIECMEAVTVVEIQRPSPYERVAPFARWRARRESLDGSQVGEWGEFTNLLPAGGSHVDARSKSQEFEARILRDGWAPVSRRSNAAIAPSQGEAGFGDRPVVVESRVYMREDDVSKVDCVTVSALVADPFRYRPEQVDGYNPVLVGVGGDIPVPSLIRPVPCVVESCESDGGVDSRSGGTRVRLVLRPVELPTRDPVQVWLRSLVGRPRPLSYETLWSELSRVVGDSRQRRAILAQVMRDEVDVGISEEQRAERIAAIQEREQAERKATEAAREERRAAYARPVRKIDLGDE
jgi:hypothetical protein